MYKNEKRDDKKWTYANHRNLNKHESLANKASRGAVGTENMRKSEIA